MALVPMGSTPLVSYKKCSSKDAILGTAKHSGTQCFQKRIFPYMIKLWLDELTNMAYFLLNEFIFFYILLDQNLTVNEALDVALFDIYGLLFEIGAKGLKSSFEISRPFGALKKVAELFDTFFSHASLPGRRVRISLIVMIFWRQPG